MDVQQLIRADGLPLQEISTLTPRSYCVGIIYEATERGHTGFDKETFESDELYRQLLNKIQAEWQKAKNLKQRMRARQLLRLLEKLGPSTGTGQFDMFKTTIRSLQPAALSVPNPLYEEFKTVDPQNGKVPNMDQWGGLVSESADILMGFSGPH